MDFCYTLSLSLSLCVCVSLSVYIYGLLLYFTLSLSLYIYITMPCADLDARPLPCLALVDRVQWCCTAYSVSDVVRMSGSFQIPRFGVILFLLTCYCLFLCNQAVSMFSFG